jgi:hypothetical protein
LLFGLMLVAVAWPLNWTLPGLRTMALFFPLWLGYVLTLDGLNERLTGTSPWRRSRLGFVLLFAAAVPSWWLFEAFNARTRNWIYLGGRELSPLTYAVVASIQFSTVIPAVLETAELLASRGWLRRLARGWRFAPTPAARAAWSVAGLAGLAAALAWPQTFYPMLWLCLIGLQLPLAAWRRPAGLTARLAQGDWRPALALALGGLTCGLFWELWNFWSLPKWTYLVPYLDVARVFEMPLPGYLGYLPFGIEVGLLAEVLLGRRLAAGPGAGS